MEINYFDIVVGAIILLLGLKGIINGFFKELFGLIGIVGGVFVASRFGSKIGVYLSDTVFKFQNDAAIKFTGFLVTLAIFWLLMIALGVLFKKLGKMSGLGMVDRLFGFVVGAGKFFFIIAIIAYATYNVKAIKSSVDESLKDSVLFPILVKTGGYIMKLDTKELNNKLNDSIDKTKKVIEDKVIDNAKDVVEKTKKELKEVMPESSQRI